jgi:lipopolysaccharide biosynthesis glycosyltransferase
MAKTVVILCLSASYWPHAAVAATSLLDHASDLRIHVFADEIKDRWVQKIDRSLTPGRTELIVHQFQQDLVRGLREFGHLGLSTYYRLFIPDLLVGETERLVYLDSDMVVRTSIHKLNDFPMKGHAVAAVPHFSKSANAAHASRLGHGIDSRYFNAGLLVIDTSQWVRQSVQQQCLDFLEASPERIKYADQDMLNYCLAGKIHELPLEWNVMVDNYGPIADDDLDGVSVNDFRKACQEPCILHYNGEFKPWHLRYRHPFKRDYTRLRQRLHRMPYVSDDFPLGLGSKLVRNVSARFFGSSKA